MFRNISRQESAALANRDFTFPAPYLGLDYKSPRASMDSRSALVLDNWIAYPNRVELRPGQYDHTTGFAHPVKGLWSWNGLTSSKLFATTDDGVFDATAAGAVGATVMALTKGRTQGVNINTGAANYLLLVNGADSMKSYDGAVWASTAALGGLATTSCFAIEVYRQRVFLLENGSMNLWYLAANAVSGAATSYALGAIFRRGGMLAALGTWTVDAGTGPDDHLVIATTEGEVAVFVGNDPASWSLQGVYYIGRPLGGARSMFKMGGDLLFLAENGVYPIAKALKVASIDKTLALTDRVQALFSSYVQQAPAGEDWSLITQPDLPLLIVNVTSSNGGRQLAMNTQNGAWNTFSGFTAKCWARLGSALYYGTDTKVVRALEGASDFNANITGTLLTAYSKFNYSRNKRVVAARALTRTTNPVDYTIGIAPDFTDAATQNTISSPLSSLSLWGSAVWGSAVWSGPQTLVEWRTVPDVFSTYKAFYTQIATKTARPAIEAWNLLYAPGRAF